MEGTRNLAKEGSKQQWMPMNDHGDQHGTVTLGVKQRSVYLGGNQSSLVGPKACSARGKLCLVL